MGEEPGRPNLGFASHISFVVALLVMAIFGGGCAWHSQTAPEVYSSPGVPASDNSSQGTPPASNGNEPAAGMLTLDNAIREALRSSPELEQINRRIDAASAQIKQADAAFYPRIIVSEEYNDTNNPVYALMNIINERRFQTNIDFNHPGAQQNFGTRIKGELSLFEGGSRWYMHKAAVGERESIRANLEAARNQLVAKVTETYYRWLQALSFIAVAEKGLESARTNERLGEARVRDQIALPSELARLKAQTAEAEGHLLTATTTARRMQAALERLLARRIGPDEVPRGLTPPQSAAEPENNPEQNQVLVKQALAKRPEMAAVRSLILASRDRVRSARGGLLPKIGANAQYMLDSEDFSDSADSWMIGVVATWPLFEGGASLARISEARAKLKEMEARGKQVALDIALEVQQAVLAVRDASEKIHVADERRKWAGKALDDVRFQYRNQIAGVDALLQSEVAWDQAEASYSAALFESAIAQAVLRQALGDFATDLGNS
jgi:outer membrane protein